jgi:hypothetical protein
MAVPQDYPQQYVNQEQQLLAQIAARRKAFLQRSGRAEQQYVQKGGGPNELGDQYEDPGDGDDLFKGDILS